MFKEFVLLIAVFCASVAMSAIPDFGLNILGTNAKSQSCKECSCTDGYFGKTYYCGISTQYKQPLKGMHSFDYMCDADENGDVYRVYFFTSVEGLRDADLMSVCVKECERIVGGKFNDNEDYGCKELITNDRKYSVQIAPVHSKVGDGRSLWLRVMVTDKTIFDAMRQKFDTAVNNNTTDVFISHDIALKQIVNLSKDYCLYPDWIQFLDEQVYRLLGNYRFNLNTINTIKLSGDQAKETRRYCLLDFSNMIFILAKYASFYMAARMDDVDLWDPNFDEAWRMKLYDLRNSVSLINQTFCDQEIWAKLVGADYQKIREIVGNQIFDKKLNLAYICQDGYAIEDDCSRSKLGMGSTYRPKDDIFGSKSPRMRIMSARDCMRFDAGRWWDDAKLELEIMRSTDVRKKFNLIFQRWKKCLSIIRTNIGSGSGFVANNYPGGDPYLYTNRHVVEGGGRIIANSPDGGTLKFFSLSYASWRDAVRCKIRDWKGGEPLKFASSSPNIGDHVAIMGNSDGLGVQTVIVGTVIGVSDDLLELDADFVNGNSGSPVLNEKGEVVGIATFAVKRSDENNWIRENTRFERTRRFAIRVSPFDEWRKVSSPKAFLRGEYKNMR